MIVQKSGRPKLFSMKGKFSQVITVQKVITKKIIFPEDTLGFVLSYNSIRKLKQAELTAIFSEMNKLALQLAEENCEYEVNVIFLFANQEHLDLYKKKIEGIEGDFNPYYLLKNDLLMV